MAGYVLAAVLAVAVAVAAWAGAAARRRAAQARADADRAAAKLAALEQAVRRLGSTPEDGFEPIESALGEWGYRQPAVLVFDEPAQVWRSKGAQGDLQEPREDAAARAAARARELQEIQAVSDGSETLVAAPLPASTGVDAVLVARLDGQPDAGQANELAVFCALLGLDHAFWEQPPARGASTGGSRRPVDSLTGLGTPSWFHDALEDHCASTAHPVAVMLVALEGVESAGDELGQRVSEEVLRIAARRLERCLRPDDLVARIDPEVFSVLLVGAADLDGAVAVGDRVIAALSGPVAVTGGAVRLGCRVGVVWDADGGGNPAMLLTDARQALRQAESGVGRCVRVGGRLDVRQTSF